MKRIWIALVMVWPLVAHADDPCANTHFMHAFDPALTRQACEAIAPVTYDRGKVARVLHPGRATTPSTPQERSAVTDVGEILSRSAVAAGQVRMPMPDKITVFLDPNDLAAENRAGQLSELEAAVHEHAAEEGECLLAYHYKSSDTAKKFAVAHQLFHCMVKKTWEEARLAAGDSNWWAEGSAEFFASIVYPGFGIDGDAQQFRADETKLLYARDKDAVVLFDWYATGPGRLKGLIDLVQDKPIGALAVDLVEELGGNQWLDFEEKYYDRQIRAPNGSVVANPNALETTQISGSTTKTFTATPYVIRAASIVFAEGHAYELDGGSENDFHWKWSEGDAGAWSDAPRIVHTCHQPRKYRLVFAAKERELTKRLRVTAREERESDCPCVVGAWQQTAASLARVPQRLQQHGVRNTSCSLDGGGTLLTFTADHNGGELYQGLHTTCTNATSTSEGTSNGTRAFTWTDTSATQITISSAGGDAHTHILVHTRGHTVETDAPMTGTGTGAVTYRCTRTDLHLEYPGFGGGTDSFDYTRAH